MVANHERISELKRGSINANLILVIIPMNFWKNCKILICHLHLLTKYFIIAKYLMDFIFSVFSSKCESIFALISSTSWVFAWPYHHSTRPLWPPRSLESASNFQQHSSATKLSEFRIFPLKWHWWVLGRKWGLNLQVQSRIGVSSPCKGLLETIISTEAEGETDLITSESRPQNDVIPSLFSENREISSYGNWIFIKSLLSFILKSKVGEKTIF